MKNQKVVFFDIYKTLFDIKTDENDFRAYEFISNWLQYQGIKISPEKLFDLYRKITKEEYELSPETYPEVEIGQVFRRVIFDEGVTSRINDGAGSVKTEIQKSLKKKNRKNWIPACAGMTRQNKVILINELALLFRIMTTKKIELFSDTISVLERLRKKVRCALISNAQRLFTVPELMKFDLLKYFETILFSSDIKVKKPSPKIFLKALRDLKIKPQDAVYVGDNLFDDIWGAKNAGMKTVWINHGRLGVFSKKINCPVPDSEIKIGEYGNLPEILFSMI